MHQYLADDGTLTREKMFKRALFDSIQLYEFIGNMNRTSVNFIIEMSKREFLAEYYTRSAIILGVSPKLPIYPKMVGGMETMENCIIFTGESWFTLIYVHS